MSFFFAFISFLLVVSMCDAAVVQSRNTKDIFVPVANIQDGSKIKDCAVDLKENETVPPARNLETKKIVENIASILGEEQKLEAVQAVTQALRRIDETIEQEGIKRNATKKEQDKEIIQTLEGEKKLESSVLENSENVAVLQPANNVERVTDAVKEFDDALENKKQHPVLIIVEANNEPNGNTDQPKDAVSETAATQNTQQNVVQQLKQNSPFGQFFNQINGETLSTSNEAVPTPAPSRPGFLQGIQQFASNLGNQFQVGFGGQQQAAGPARPQ